MAELSLTTVPRDLYYVERKLVADQAAEIGRLRAALLVARETIHGHFDDGCAECRNALAVIDAARVTT